MYLDYFGLDVYPFSLTPNTDFFVSLPSHKQCLDMLVAALREGEGFVKIVGEVGSGKTLLCRKLISMLDPKEFYTAYIPNPYLNPLEIRFALAYELEIFYEETLTEHTLLETIYDRLILLANEGKKVVLIIDEAQAMSPETLEAVRLLTNLETETEKLLQVVLFGQPELDKQLANPGLRQFRQRITFSKKLHLLNKELMQQYIGYRLMGAGFSRGQLFLPNALKKLHKLTQGTPRLINIVCHKAMIYAFSQNQFQIDEYAIRLVAQETEGLKVHSQRFWPLKIVG